jgi:hypothetical protein
MMLPKIIYALCAVTSLATAAMLLRYYVHRRTTLLLWSCIAFLGLAVNNVMVFVDLALFTSTDLSLLRTIAGTVAMLALVFGLVWEVHE